MTFTFHIISCQNSKFKSKQKERKKCALSHIHLSKTSTWNNPRYISETAGPAKCLQESPPPCDSQGQLAMPKVLKANIWNYQQTFYVTMRLPVYYYWGMLSRCSLKSGRKNVRQQTLTQIRQLHIQDDGNLENSSHCRSAKFVRLKHWTMKWRTRNQKIAALRITCDRTCVRNLNLRASKSLEDVKI